MWVYRDKAGSTAASARLVGGNSLSVQTGHGVKFGDDITPDSPMRITVYRGTTLLGVLKCVGRTGDVLQIDGPVDDYADFAVQQNDKVGNIPLAGDFNDLWGEISTVIDDIVDLNTDLNDKEDKLPTGGTSGQFLAFDRTWQTPPANDLSGYYDKDEVDDLLSEKQDSLPSGGTSSNYLRGDGVWATPPTTSPGGSSGQIQFNNGGAFAGSSSLVYDSANKRVGLSTTPSSTLDVQANGSEDLLTLRNSSGAALVKVLSNGGFAPQKMRFVLGRYIDLAAGTSLTLPTYAAYTGTLVKVQVSAESNPVGGGFTFDIKKNGTSIFSAGQTVAANTTTLQTITAFSNTSVSAGDTFTIDISSPGTGVQNVIIELVYLARNQ